MHNDPDLSMQGAVRVRLRGDLSASLEEPLNLVPVTASPTRQSKPASIYAWVQWARVELVGFMVVVLVGVLLGMTLPVNPDLTGPYARVSNILGYVYFLAWTISFYPQLIENYQRGTSEGLSLDFELLNLLGFLCYTIYTYMFKFSDSIHEEYAARNNGQTSKVEIQDLLFAGHAAAITAVTIVQMFWLDGLHQRLTRLWGGLAGLLAVLALGSYVAMPLGIVHMKLIDWLYFISYIKLTISIVKGFPQAFLNYQRKSTEGWSFHNVLCDFMGGSLSLLQLLLDCHSSNDWSGIAGDPVKFGLGLVSVVFDVVFILQHCVLYRADEKRFTGLDKISERDRGFSV